MDILLASGSTTLRTVQLNYNYLSNLSILQLQYTLKQPVANTVARSCNSEKDTRSYNYWDDG